MTTHLIRRHRLQPEICVQRCDIAAAVVQTEQKATRQRGQLRGLTDELVEFGEHRSQVGLTTDAAGQRGADDVAHQLVGGTRQQSGRGYPADQLVRDVTGVIDLDPSELQVAPRCQLHLPIAELDGGGRHARERSGGDPAPGQTEPDQRAVRRPVRPE